MTLTSEQIAEGWIAHDGGVCPVDEHVRVQVLFHKSHIPSNLARAGAYYWTRGSVLEPTDIVAYRPEHEIIPDLSFGLAHWSRFNHGDSVHVIRKRATSPAFPGYVIGTYQRRNGERGYVLEHERDGIVHVYPEVAVVEGWEP
jgi:hypothetical protein